jgi:alginate O-acetyltransferase complex protein AlgI
LVTFAWIFFRANSLPDAFYIISHLWTSQNQLGIVESLNRLGNPIDIGVAVGSVICLLIVEAFQSQRAIRPMLAKQPLVIRWVVYYILIMAIIVFAQITNPIEFIYFQF